MIDGENVPLPYSSNKEQAVTCVKTFTYRLF